MADVVARNPRTRLAHSARRAQLVAVGVELLRSRPLDQLSLEDVAAAAGISRALPFHYFSTRNDFLVAVVGFASEQLLEATNPDPAMPPLARLRHGLEGYIDYIEGNATAYIALVRGAAGADEELRAVFDATREVIVDRILEGLGLIEENGLTRLAIRGWLGMVEETAVSWLRLRNLSRADVVWLLDEALVRTIGAIAERTGLDPRFGETQPPTHPLENYEEITRP
ncbi:MAG: TetR/AcrR family transcriptional regulator [Acidimicrobiales bacterium]